MIDVAHQAVIWSNLTAFFLIRDAIAMKHTLLAALALISSTSSATFHAMHNAQGVRDATPLILVLDRLFAVLLACRVLTLSKTMGQFGHALKAALPAAIPAAFAGALSEVARGGVLYSPLHTTWHLLIFVAARTFVVANAQWSIRDAEHSSQ